MLAASAVAACGLSLTIPDVEDPGLDAQPTPTTPVPTSDATAPPPNDALPPPVDGAIADAMSPDGNAPDGNVADARPDVMVDASDGGGCTTVLKEDFTTNAGALTIASTKTAVEGGRLRLLGNGNDTINSQGGAYYNLPADLLDFNATFTLTTDALGAVFVTADGFAFSWMERAFPANPTLRPGNDLGMSLSGGAMQRGYASVLDIYPASGEERYFSTNVLGPSDEVRNPAGGTAMFGDLVGTGAATLKYSVQRRGATYTFRVDRSGTAQNGAISRTITLGNATTPYRAVLFSSAAGAARSPGMYLDDVEIQSCP